MSRVPEMLSWIIRVTAMAAHGGSQVRAGQSLC